MTFAGWEIEEEVKAGRVKKTPSVTAYLDSWKRECETREQAARGALVDPAIAREAIADSVAPLGRRFLTTFEQVIDPDYLVGIEHKSFGISQHFLSGRLRRDPSVEVTIRGGLFDRFIDFLPILEIGLVRGEKLMCFNPHAPESPRTTGWMPSWATKGLQACGLIKKVKESEPTFPHANPEFGATIRPHGEFANPTFEVTVTDQSLANYAENIRAKVTAVSSV